MREIVFLSLAALAIWWSVILGRTGAYEPDKLTTQPSLQQFLDSLPPMSDKARKSFDTAARVMYDPKCECFAYLFKDGKIYEAPLPLSDSDRYHIV